MQRTIITLRNEVNDLNAQIMVKISAIPAEENDPDSKLNKIQVIKNILLSQRQELSWKNDDLADFEEKLVVLAAEFFKLKKTNESLKRENDQLRNNGVVSPPISTDLSTAANETSDKIIQMQKEIKKLKQEKSELEEKSQSLDEKNRMLKAALLMTVDTETKDVNAPAATLREDKVIKSKDLTVETQDSSEKVVNIQEGPSSIKAPTGVPDRSERKKKCPKCGAAGAFVLEITDKEHVIYQDMGTKMYGKKYKCGDCRHEWK
jgi:DNA repair exonuclease SbcCD ATPase subunit